MIFGSVAAKHWFPDFRDPQDIDILNPDMKLKNRTIQLYWSDAMQYVWDNNKHHVYVDPDFLYTIKVSHAAWDIHWVKTMKDIRFFKYRGCKLDKEFYNLLIKDWEKIHGKKNVYLKGKPDEFFKPTVNRWMDHDLLHTWVAFYDRPLHERIREDKNDVKVSEALWNQLSHDDKLKCCLEETYVFALERYLELPPSTAFQKALKQLIVSSTKGFFNLFLIEHFDELMDYPKNRYFEIYNKVKGMKNDKERID